LEKKCNKDVLDWVSICSKYFSFFSASIVLTEAGYQEATERQLLLGHAGAPIDVGGVGTPATSSISLEKVSADKKWVLEWVRDAPDEACKALKVSIQLLNIYTIVFYSIGGFQLPNGN
jgi:hypothetical protein